MADNGRIIAALKLRAKFHVRFGCLEKAFN